MKITIQSLPGQYSLPASKQTYANNKLTKSYSGVVNVKPDNFLMDMSYKQLLIKKSISFGETQPNPPIDFVPVKKTPIEAQISTIYQLLNKNDIILVGNNINEAEALLENSISSINDVIKKVYFIKYPSIKGAISIYQDDKGYPNLLNLGSKAISIEYKEDKAELEQGQYSYMPPNTNIKIDGLSFDFKQYDPADLNILGKDTIKMFDFSKLDQGTIIKLNCKHLEQLISATEQVYDKPEKITFKDVGGQDEAIARLKKSVVYPLKYPSYLRGQRVGHGVILEGEPGTGKTLMAQALANESDAYFIKLNGLEMESKWMGQSEENWRKLFKEAKEHQPCIIFIDEFDAVAKQRQGTDISRHDDKIVDQLLTLLDDLEKNNTQIYVVAATNRLDLLDNAITRPGRFGHHIKVGKPDLVGCEKILELNIKNKPVDETFNVKGFAKELFEMKATGADISDIASEARSNAFERTGIFEKMENETYTEKDLESLKIIPEDFTKAIDTFIESRKPKKAKIGFDTAPQTKKLAA